MTFDVVVVGGGSAGVGAAVGAAQTGGKVCLVERYPFFGGAATVSSVLSYCGFFDQNRERVVGGVGELLLARMRAAGAYEEITADGGASLALNSRRRRASPREGEGKERVKNEAFADFG
jgi:glycine/D-amino acid oxidase-like deaminating enzyme